MSHSTVFRGLNTQHFFDSLELTEKEKIEKAKKEKIILHGNTRLVRTPWKSESQEDKIRKAVENREAMEAGENIEQTSDQSECRFNEIFLPFREGRC